MALQSAGKLAVEQSSSSSSSREVANGQQQQEQERLRLSGPCHDSHFLRHPFTKQFAAALHTLLISCSRQDVMSYFPHFQPRYQDFLYKVFTLTVTQIRENVAAEFQSICDETQILEALDHMSSREFLGAAPDVRQFVSPKDVVLEVAVKRKLEEVNSMKQTLQQTKEENELLAAQLDGLRAKVEEARDLRSVDAVIDKISSINLMLESAIREDSVSSRNVF